MSKNGKAAQKVRVIGDLLKALHDQAHSAEESKPHPLLAVMPQAYGPVQREFLEKILQPKSPYKGHLANHNFLYLEPLYRGDRAVPILTFDYDLGTEPPSLNLRVMLFHKEKDQDKVNSVGFRLETPQGAGTSQDQAHGYHHSQMISALNRSQNRAKIGNLKVLRAWVPETNPAWPLAASSPIGLLVCLIIGLYGMDMLRTLNLRSETQREVSKELKKVNLPLPGRGRAEG